jgi:GTP 3',8-cyclase
VTAQLPSDRFQASPRGPGSVPATSPLASGGGGPLDQRGRPLHDLRISVTDRCNFRCRYCMPREKFEGRAFLPRSELLSFEEITRVAHAFVALGVRKLRLTGGEPLLRKDLHRLIELLRPLGAELALTTNGVLLEEQADVLARAGLNRATVSLDALDDDVFQRMSDAPHVRVADVLRGVDAALRAGLGPLKVNCVVRRGVNDDQIEKLVRHFRGTGCSVRFIEFMDVGSTNGWRLDEVVTGEEILDRVRAVAGVEPIVALEGGEVARRYRFTEGGGEIGVITSVSQPFCGACSRARLSAEGQVYTCLFASSGTDVRALVRNGMSDEELQARLAALWAARSDRYSELRSSLMLPEPNLPTSESTAPERKRLPTLQPRVEMSYIGG